MTQKTTDMTTDSLTERKWNPLFFSRRIRTQYKQFKINKYIIIYC